MSHHLVILKKTYIDRILSGCKTIECRLSRTRRPPFGAVTARDVLWLKVSAGPVVAATTVRRVSFLHPLEKRQLADLQAHYADALQDDGDYFAKHRQARYATFIHLGPVRRITPLIVPKRDRRAWVVLTEPLVQSPPPLRPQNTRQPKQYQRPKQR